MTILTVENLNGQLVVDSRLVAYLLGIEDHTSWYLNVVKKYQTEIEQSFGNLNIDFEALTKGSKAGQKESFAWLTEEQAAAVMTLTPNTQQIASGKLSLVKRFTDAKKKPPAVKEQADQLLTGFEQKERPVALQKFHLVKDKQYEDMPGLDFLLEELSKKVSCKAASFSAPDWLEQQDPEAAACNKFKMSFSLMLSSLYKALKSKSPEQDGCRALYTNNDRPLLILAYKAVKDTLTIKVNLSEINKLSQVERAVIGKEMTLRELVKNYYRNRVAF